MKTATIQARNETAYTIGFVFGIFAVWGIAHIYNGRVGDGLVKMFIMMPVNAVISAAMGFTVIGIPWGLKRWFKQAQQQAEDGARPKQ